MSRLFPSPAPCLDHGSMLGARLQHILSECIPIRERNRADAAEKGNQSAVEIECGRCACGAGQAELSL